MYRPYTVIDAVYKECQKVGDEPTAINVIHPVTEEQIPIQVIRMNLNKIKRDKGLHFMTRADPQTGELILFKIR